MGSNSHIVKLACYSKIILLWSTMGGQFQQGNALYLRDPFTSSMQDP